MRNGYLLHSFCVKQDYVKERHNMDIQELKKRKQELGYSNQQIADLSGVPLSTVQKVFGGSTRTPRHDTLEAIESVLFTSRDIEKRLREMDEMEKRQGQYTVADYLDLPDDTRMELIEGRLYNLAAPSSLHQYLVGELFASLRSYKTKSHHSCIPMMGPLDVQLDCDERTMVQPDVLAICDISKFRDGRVYGAPELVMEILSPSTRGVDLVLKMNKYWKAGVKEYWIIDPQNREVIVYEFSKGIPPENYSFTDVIPVGLTDGDLSIDFGIILENMNIFLNT